MTATRFPVVYHRATTPATGPQPGALALMTWCLGAYPVARNLGIFNVRAVRGGSSLSTHAEGRAIDVGMPVVHPLGHPDGWHLAHRLVEHHGDLGVQLVIFARQVWSVNRGWRPYTGQADHFDHLHVELNRDAAAQLTLDMIRHEVERNGVTTNSHLVEVQRMINSWLPSHLHVDPNGVAGPATEEAMRTMLRGAKETIVGFQKVATDAVDATEAARVLQAQAERAHLDAVAQLAAARETIEALRSADDDTRVVEDLRSVLLRIVGPVVAAG